MLPVRIYDFWGLEADKYEEWIKKLDVEFEKRGNRKISNITS